MKMTARIKILILLAVLLLPAIVAAQGGTGLPFLKIGVGARQAGMGLTFTGVGDDIFTLYTNPGGLGHLRRWQWAAAYNRWFTDVYQANLSFAKQYRIIGSRKTTFGAFVTYLGMPSWDSTGGLDFEANASHLVGGFSVAQRLDWLSQSISIGATIKGIYSKFDTYSAKAIAADVGILLKAPRFKLGLGPLEYGIITLGVSMLHIGQDITFDNESTSLPRTLVGGVSLKMGSYKTWSWLIAADMYRIEKQDWRFSGAAELWWKEIIGIRAGYRFNDRDLGELGFGISLRWDDVFLSLIHI